MVTDIIERMRNGERISETAPELLCDEIESTAYNQHLP